MTFKVGDTVVYPHHGAALIEKIENRVVAGEKKDYLVLKITQGDLTVMVPAVQSQPGEARVRRRQQGRRGRA